MTSRAVNMDWEQIGCFYAYKSLQLELLQSIGSDCNLCDQHVLTVLSNMQPVPDNVEAGGTGVLIKWPASIPSNSEGTQITG
jgi:hypothetical protein